MFECLQDKNVQLMLKLSRENKFDFSSLVDELASVDMHEFFILCVEHELEGVIAARILKHDICELTGEWRDAYERDKARLSFLKNKASDICDLMDKNGIKMVILKNGGIMSDMVEDVAACPMEDIDSLVKKSDFLKAHALLEQSGLKFTFRSQYEKEDLDAAFREGSTEYYIDMPGDGVMWFELAWRAVAGRWIRQDLEPDTNELIDRAYKAKDSNIGVLSPEDNLLQVCVHTAKHSYVRAPGLRLHLDVERIVAHKKIDWDMFVQRVKSAHVKISTYFSLYFAKMLFDTPIPNHVFAELEPKRAKKRKILKIIDKVGLLYPKKKKFTKIQFLRFQTALYDTFYDMLRVLYPKNGRLHEIYNYKSPFLTPFYIILRAFDLMGIRRKK